MLGGSPHGLANVLKKQVVGVRSFGLGNRFRAGRLFQPDIHWGRQGWLGRFGRHNQFPGTGRATQQTADKVGAGSLAAAARRAGEVNEDHSASAGSAYELASRAAYAGKKCQLLNGPSGGLRHPVATKG